jgi:hypothetical protein
MSDGSLQSAAVKQSAKVGEQIVAVGHQVDGRIITMGWHQESGSKDIAIARYGINGSLGDPLLRGSSRRAGRPIPDPC